MSSQRRWTRAAVLVAAALVLGACSDTAVRASNARVVVEVTTEDPLRLVVSTDFDMVLNLEDGSYTPFLQHTDTLEVTVGFDEVYALDRTDPRFYVKLENEEGEVENVRMQVLLDGETAYDVSYAMAAGTHLEYVYHFSGLTTGTGG